MLKNLADMFRGFFGRRTRKSVAADRRRDFLNQFRKGRVEGLEDRALMAQLLAFDFFGENTGVATSTAEIVGANLDSPTTVTRGAGAAPSTANNSFRTVGFQNDGISVSNTDYFQVQLSASPGHELDLSTVDARFAGTAGYAASPGVSHQFAYSLDGTNFTLIGSPVTTIGTPATLPQLDLSGVAALQDVTDGVTVTLRYYASGQTTTGGWGFFSSAAGTYGLDISGTVTPAAAATATTTTLNSVTPLTVDAGSNVAFAGTVVASSGTLTPTGTVEIRNGGSTGTLLASLTPISGSGATATFSINSTTVPVGAFNNIQAFYVPGSGFSASSSSVFGSTLTVNAMATPFTPGNLAVLVAAASANNTTASVIEIDTTTAGQATPTLTIPIGATGSDALRVSGSATSTLYASRSADGSLFTFTGHNSTSTSGNANAILPRGVGTLNSSGTFALQTTYTGTGGNQTRSATTLNGTDWFIADQGGIYTNGATTASPTGNIRGIKPFGGSVYAAAASSSASVIQVSAVSAPSGGTLTGLPGLTNNNNMQDFYLISSGDNGSIYDMLYVLSATNDTTGTIAKYSLLDTNGNTILGDAGDLWTTNGTYTTSFGGFGLAAEDVGSGAALYVTSGQGGLAANRVIKVADAAGYNGTIDVTTGNNVTLYTAPSGNILKGLDFAPASVVAVAPTVIGPTQSSVTLSSATLGGNVTNDGGATITERGIVYSVTTVNGTPTIGGTGVTKVTVVGTTGVFTEVISGLTASTGYSYRAFATNSQGTTYTTVDAFTTAAAAVAPTVTNPTVTAITETGATLGGNVASDGGATITERGAVYSLTGTNNDPLIGGAGVIKVVITGTTGVFSQAISGLTASSGYSYKAYATNGVDTSYSTVSSFSTAAAPSGPVIAVNRTITLNPGQTVAISDAILLATDVDSPDSSLTYTVTTPPTAGTITKNGAALALNQFTNADLKVQDSLANAIRYTATGPEGTNDTIVLSLTDGLTTVPVTISISIVASTAPLGYAGGAYTQSFDNRLPTTPSVPGINSSLPAAMVLPAGWLAVESVPTNGDNSIKIGDGSPNGGTLSGDVYFFGTGTSNERAFGSFSSGSVTSDYGLALINNSTDTYSTFTLKYTGEQWRRGDATGSNQNKLVFAWAVNPSSFTATSGFAAATALSFVAPNQQVGGGLTQVSLDGNDPANQVEVGGAAGVTVTGLGWAPGQTLYLRWSDANETGNDDGLSLDNISFSAAVAATNTDPTLGNHAATFLHSSAQSLSADMLQVSDSEQGPGSITYTVTALPAAGTLTLNNNPVVIGGPNNVFTQNDINVGNVRYTAPVSGTTDGFAFTAVDGVVGSTPISSTFNITLKAAPVVLLNEIDVNPPGDDFPNEYVEIKGTPGESLAGIYFVSIEGDATGPRGTFSYALNLSSQVFGSNGLLVITGTSSFTFPAGTTVVNGGASFESGGALQNGANSFALLYSPNTPITTGDYDVGDTGSLTLPSSSLLLDAVGWNDSAVGAGDTVYGGVTLTRTGGANSHAATRIVGNTTAFSAAAWYNGLLVPTTGNTSLGYDQAAGSSNLPIGAVLTPGDANYAAVVNNAPTDLALSANSLVENAGVNAIVGTFTTTDPDAGNSFTYTLAPGTGDTNNSLFNISDDTLRATSSLDFETQSSYTVRVRTTDQGSLSFEKEFIITVTDVMEVLQVTAFTPTTTGFIATFSQSLVVTDLNLYDANPSALGLADVTVVGSSLGSVRGSLIVNAAGTQVTFVRTGGALGRTTGDETYTVTLRSAANGFHTTGGLLDGNPSIAGDENYVTTFQVLNTTGKYTVSLPDFARGYGQAVNVPQNVAGVGLPLTISSGLDVGSVQLTVAYDPALLSITDFELDPAVASAGFSASVNTTVSGEVTVGIFGSGSALSTGAAVTLGKFIATVPNTTLYAAKQVLNITNLEVANLSASVLPSIDNDAVHIAMYFGDVNATRSYTSADAGLVASVGVGLGTGFVAYQLADPVIVADINASANLTSADAGLVAQRGVGLSVPQIPVLPTGITPTPGLFGQDPTLFLGSATGVANDTIIVPLNVQIPPSESGNVQFGSYTVVVQYDPTQLTFSDVTNSAYTNPTGTANDFALAVNDLGNGILIFSGFTSGASGAINNTSGLRALANIEFTVNEGAAGISALNLRADFDLDNDGVITASDVVTSLQSNGTYTDLLLSPVPTNNSNDAGVDGTFTVPSVPLDPTDITLSNATVAENLGPGAFVGTFTTADQPGDTHTYSFVAGAGSTHNSLFTIVGDELRTGIDFDFEAGNILSVRVRTTDQGGLFFDKQFTITLTNVNEQPTVTVAGGPFSLPENSDLNTLVATAVGSDVDAGQTATLIYSIDVAGNTGGAFSINSAGEIRVANQAALDFEVNPTFTLTVRVTDTGSPALSGTTTIVVNLTDVFEPLAPIYINEIYLNPQGTDAPHEFVELRGTPGAVIPAGTYLLGIEGDAGTPNPGDVQNIFNLSGLTFGSNGLILLLQKGSLYDVSAAAAAGTTIVINTGTGAGWGNGASSSLGHAADSGATDLENASSSFLLVNTAIAPTLTDDIDALNNGTAGGFYANWTILDSVGLLNNDAGAFGYAAINFRQGLASTGSSTTGIVVPFAGEVEWVARIGTSTGATTADWLAADSALSPAAPNFALSTNAANVTDPVYRGSPINTIGLPNNFTLVAPTDIALSNDSIPENSATGSTIGQFTTTDPTPLDTHTYTLVTGTGSTDNTAFTLTTAGVLTINGSADFETKPSYSIRVRSTDAGGTNVEKAFTISVTNVNENPFFSPNTATFTIGENAGNGTNVGTVTAQDPDADDTHTYAITAGNGTGTGAFAIGPTGQITVADTAQMTVQTFILTVTATDAGFLTGTITVSVDVSANQAPVFGAPSYTFPLAENSLPGTSVGSVSATDPELVTIIYGLDTSPGSDNFVINSSTGEITVAVGAVLDFEGLNTFNLTATASDGFITTPVSVTVNLTNVNEAPTVTSGASANFVENATGTVYTITAIDPDASTTLIYSIGGTDAGLFNVSAGGAVTFKSSPNFEAPADAGADNVYNITVTASDGSLPNSKAVAITVTNENEAPTVTSGATANFAENGVGTAYQITATDPDAATTLIYSISGVDAGLFNVSGGGAVTFKSSPNFEAPADAGGDNVYDITVIASDGSLPDSKAVAISVTNVNEAPTITLGSTFTVPENSGSSGFATATSSDPDGTTPTYTLSGADAALFQINNAGLLAFLADPNFENPLDQGADNVYNLIVNATDGVSTPASQAVAVTVTNVNEAPVFSAGPFLFSVLDTTAAVGSNVGTVAATDPDAGNTLTYSITNGNGAGAGAFAISATGQITVLDPSQINASLTPAFNLTIRATDNGSPTQFTDVPVTVNVTHTNLVPTGLALVGNSIEENNAVGAPIGLFSTADGDNPNDTHTYTLMTTGAGSTDHASFTILGNQLRANASFDFETKTSYSIRVRTTDQGGATYEKVFTIFVTNVVETGNQAPTNIALSGTHKVAPTATTGMPVGTLTTSDPNAGNIFNYTLGGVDAAKFMISGAILRLASNVAPDPVDTVYSISVTSTDQGGLFFTKNFSITVAVAPNVAPTALTLTGNSIAENNAFFGLNNLLNALIGSFTTTDAANPGDTHTYTLVSGVGSTDNAKFFIPVGTNEVRANASFDFETKSSYTIRVRTTDNGSPLNLSFEKVFTIFITNIPGA